ncbi:hypothetical protein Tco_0702802 [Tanacetum coccineum]|uniref:Uncharacterized protein n=1 Tax=Tanacetum coccineum TaxID=301880 RepID=A0ABQ4XYM2_9ASTR
MLAPKCATYNGRSTFANPKYLKKAQSDKPCLYEIPYDTSDPANRFCPNGEETVTLEKESRSKLDKDKVKPYDYTYQNSLYETFKPPSNKTTNRNKPVEQIRVATKPKRQILKRHRFSIKKTTTVHVKTITPRSCLRWQPTGRILKTVYLRWVPTGKTFASSTTKVESEPPNGSNADITNQCESKQALNVSAGTLLSTGTSFNPTEEGLRVWLRKRKISQKTGLQGILI